MVAQRARLLRSHPAWITVPKSCVRSGMPRRQRRRHRPSRGPTFRALGRLMVAVALLTTCSQDQTVGPAGPRPAAPVSPGISAAVVVSGQVLVGAGDIARCDRT